MGRLREDTPGGQKETPWVLPEATPWISMGSFNLLCSGTKRRKKSGIYSFVIVYQEREKLFFFLIFILIRVIEILNIF